MQENKNEFTDISGSFNSDETENEVSFVSPKNIKPPEKKSTIKKVGIVAAIFVLLCGSVAAAALSGLLKSPNSEVNAGENSEKTVSSVPESSIPKEESVEEESTLSYEPTGKFTLDNKVFSESVLRELDEKVTARYVVLYDATSDKIIFQRNANKKCYPASTTKMLTAIVNIMMIFSAFELWHNESVGISPYSPPLFNAKISSSIRTVRIIEEINEERTIVFLLDSCKVIKNPLASIKFIPM